ncbi:hypothetical protein JHK85_004986 [Glycine max]|nr:hypothetical protein JHK85_004986 [Glycine max]KAG5080756.1 hypothetical protein JHK86_004821 [Glycine max]
MACVSSTMSVYRELRTLATPVSNSKNDLHERDEGELERTGQPLCIYEPYFGEGSWSFLHQKSLYRGIGLPSKGRRLGRDNVDALSCLPLLNNGYYRDLLGEDGAFLQLQIGLTVYTKMLGLDLSWRATTKKLEILCLIRGFEIVDIMIALQLMLRKSLAYEGLARGLHEGAKGIEKHDVQLRSSRRFLLIVPGAKTLGEWASLCKIDSEGKARKVIGCSCSCATLTTSLHKLRLGFFLLHGKCKSYEKAKKKMTVLEAPNVLTIALKRFQSGKFGKLNKPIRFPEILDLASFMSGTSDLPIYRLHGVVVHLDIMSASFLGHYVCYVKNFQSSWFKVDDSVVATIALLEADYVCGSHSVAIPLVLVLPNLYGFNQCVSGSTKTLERKLLF